jgi:hypothetical protein
MSRPGRRQAIIGGSHETVVCGAGMADSSSMAQGSLPDRIHGAMLKSRRTWGAGEIGQVFLRLQGSGPEPQGLIRGLLGRDGRFVENPAGHWSARVVASPPLQAASYLLAWVETGERAWPGSWRLHLRPHHLHSSGPTVAGGRNEDLILTPPEPEPWWILRARLTEHRLATLQVGPLSRLMQWMERCSAVPEPESPPLDLLAWTRVELVAEGVASAESRRAAQLPALASRWGWGPVSPNEAGAPLPAMALLLDHLIERHGSWSEADLESAWKETLGSRPLPWERFAFTPADLASVPESAGIYRFWDEQDGLLYVGKAARLNRRVNSYFRPLPPEPSKREELLRLLHRFEVTPLPSELEALVCEAAAIRHFEPRWNVQVEVHPLDRYPPDWWWPLVFIAPGQDPTRASAFLVPGPEQACLFHLPRQGEMEGLDALIPWLDRELEVTPEPGDGDGGAGAIFPVDELPEPEAGDLGDPPGVTRLKAPEARLVLRYFLRQRETLHRLDAVHFTSGQVLAEALLALAAAPDATGDVLDLRPPRP